MIDLDANLDARFFASLASVNERALLETLTAVAVRKDLASMNGFLDFFENKCADGSILDVDLVTLRPGMLIHEPAAENATNCLHREERATLARALVRPFQEDFASAHHPFSEEEAAYATRMASVLAMLPDSARAGVLDLALFEACNQTRCALVFNALMDAGATLDARIKTRAVDRRLNQLRKGDVTAFDEAIHHGNFAGAVTISRRMTDELIVQPVEMLVHDVSKTDKTPISGFRANAMGDALVCGIAGPAHGHEAIAELLGLLNTSATASIAAPDMMPQLHAGLMTGYLTACTESAVSWRKEALALAAGPRGLDREGLVASWIRDKVDEGAMRTCMGDSLTSVALSSHCHVALAICEPVLDSMAQHPNLAHAMNIGYTQAIEVPARLSTPETMGTDLVRFSETIKGLRDCGFTLDEPITYGVSSKGNSLHVCAQSQDVEDMLLKMPVLLAFGCDPKALDDCNKLPVDLVKDPEAKARWISIEASFRARNAAMTILEDLEIDSEPKEKSAPCTTFRL